LTNRLTRHFLLSSQHFFLFFNSFVLFQSQIRHSSSFIHFSFNLVFVLVHVLPIHHHHHHPYPHHPHPPSLRWCFVADTEWMLQLSEALQSLDIGIRHGKRTAPLLKVWPLEPMSLCELGTHHDGCDHVKA
jgi:hypothetical protein